MLNRFLNSWYFHLFLGLAVLAFLAIIMFDAVAISVLGRSVFFDYPK